MFLTLNHICPNTKNVEFLPKKKKEMFSKINVFYHVGVLKNNKIKKFFFLFLENVPLKSFQKKKKKVSFQNNKVSVVTFYFKHFSQNSCKDLCSRLILLSLGTPFKLTLSLPFLGTNDLSLSSFFCMIKKEKKKREIENCG